MHQQYSGYSMKSHLKLQAIDEKLQKQILYIPSWLSDRNTIDTLTALNGETNVQWLKLQEIHMNTKYRHIHINKINNLLHSTINTWQ